VKFAVAVNLERFDPAEDVRDVTGRALELVQMADAGGFEMVLAQEHHTIEFVVGPNPFTAMSFWAANTKQIRLGTAVVVPPFWHPIRLAGEAALFDVMSGGRLELGFGRGAYQHEFDRMAGGMPHVEGGEHMREMLPLVKSLWQGDVEHRGKLWSFPRATSVPKPLQNPHPPIWVAARDPGTFDWAIKQGAHIMATPLSRPHAEVETLVQRFNDTLAANPGVPSSGPGRPRLLMLRRGCVYEDAAGEAKAIEAAIMYGRRFENLFKNIGTVTNGFPEAVELAQIANRAEFDPDFIRTNMIFGRPDEVVRKLRAYEALGIDVFAFSATFGLPYEMTKRSLELFIREVMPHFSTKAEPARAAE
jgi:alkanesulfonate monooxygenase SsuD/methylene tetrahydromethanopterin reductase-like flavin-dependent oxidoreductase (luciferase family)